MESTEDAPTETTNEVVEEKLESKDLETTETSNANEEVQKSEPDIFENVSEGDNNDLFAKPEVAAEEPSKKHVPTEKDLFDDVSEGDDLFDDKTPAETEPPKYENIFGIDEDDQKDDKDDLAGIDDKDLFTGNTQQCDLFDDDDDDEDTVDNNMQGTMAIPVRTNSGQYYSLFTTHLYTYGSQCSAPNFCRTDLG